MKMIQLEGPLDGTRLFKCTFQGKGPFALKKLEWTTRGENNLQEWQSLVGLRNENVVSYHHCDVRDSISYLVMDLCWASMLDFCLGRLMLDVSDTVEMGRIMSETARGLHFLHRNNIVHGRLGLDRILLWRKRPNVKPIAKISGYYPHHHHNQPKIEDDLKALGRIFYSMATNDVNPPKELFVSPKQLTLVALNQRTSASEMINLLLMDSSELKPNSVDDLLLGQSFFQTGSNQDRLRDVKELDDFQKLVEGDFNVEGLKELIVESLDANQHIEDFVTKAFEKYPELFAEFIWDLSSYPPLETLTFVERPPPSILGYGSAGMVLAGKWIKGNGHEEMAVACKRFYRHNGGTDKFHREYQTLRQLDHLFVVKCFGPCEIQFDKCILMELCEGTLKNYVLGELETIPKDSLDDKIILGQVTLGLSYIHSREMIHKDLKPSNILLWRSPVQHQQTVLAKLADFDFAKQSKTGRGDFSGTFRPGTEGYMAPELLEGLSRQPMRKVLATVHSDAYSLGIVIGFTVLKGQHPFGNQMTRGSFMQSGADPVLLGNLDWDVTDLILRLTRKDPKERPNVSLLIYHPYFVLANEKTKAHFADRFDDYLNLFESPYQARMTYINRVKIQEWMQVITSQTEREANAQVKKRLEQMSEIVLKETMSHLDNSQEYYEKIKREIQSDNENDVNTNLHNDAIKSQLFSDNFRDWPLWTRRLIQLAPRFAVSYFWCLLNDRTEDSPTHKNSISALVVNYLMREQNKVKHPDVLRVADILKIEEHVHACLHLKRQEGIEEIWNYKRGGQLEAGQISDREIHRLLRELPLYATPPSIIRNLTNRLANINSYDQDETTVLHWVLRNRWEKIDVSIVLELLRRKADPNLGDKQGSTPVHYAARNESSEGMKILKLVLENGGDPGKMNGPERRRTPLHYAAMNESSYAPGIVHLLLAFDRVQVNVFDAHGFTPVHYAARNKSMEAPGIMKSLLDNGGDPDKTLIRTGMTPPFQRTPVHIATMNESQSGLGMLKLLLEKRGDPNVCDYNRETPVHYAAKSESIFGPAIFKILLENEGNAEAINLNHQRPIHFIAQNTSTTAPSLMKMILERGGNPNIPFRDGGTAVHLAANNNSEAGLQMLRLVLDRNGDPNQKDRWAKSPVHHTAQSRCQNGPNVMKLLLEKGGDPNALDSDGATPVHLAAANDSGIGPDLLKVLVAKGGKVVEVFDQTRKTPTHLAAANPSDSGLNILKILLENGADPNAADDNQETPVHHAARNESKYSAAIILQFLLENGGNCNVLNRRNQTPFDLALANTSHSALQLLEMLLEKGSNATNSRGVVSIHLAAANQSESGPKILTRLIENGGDCNAVDGDQRTALHYAAKNQSGAAAEMVTILLDKGCDPNATSTRGVTPVHMAAQNEGTSALSLLKLLHENGANLNVADDGGTTAVHLAAAQTQTRIDLMKYLLDNGGDVHINAVDVRRDDIVMRYVIPDINWRIEEQRLLPDGKRKRTPVHYAAENEKTLTEPNYVLQLVLERGGNANVEDERKRTPVHLAVLNGGLSGSEMLKVLLKHEGNPNAVDDRLMTPVHFAAKTQVTIDKVKRIKLLMKHGGDPNAVDSSGLTPVHYAAMNESNLAPKILDLLLEKNGNPNAVDSAGLTPVHCCLIKNPSARVAVKILELLMKHGGDPEAPDNEGKTPIDLLAAKGQSTEMQIMWNILKPNQRH